MIKLDKDYSDYVDETDEKYPAGKAVNASSSESYDGTPWLDTMMNDIHGARQAIFKKAYGSVNGLSGEPDNADESDTLNAIKKLIDDPAKAHADLRGTDAHGATVEASPGQIVTRDEFGRAKVAAPLEGDDIARKSDVDDAEKRAKGLGNATGVLDVAKGGTGATTVEEAHKKLVVNQAKFCEASFEDGSVLVGLGTDNIFIRQTVKLWEYIKGKISSVLGLTASNYNGKAKGLQSVLLIEGANLNDYTVTGRYHAIGNTEYANAPCINFSMEVIQLLTDFTCQIVYEYISGAIFTRTSYYDSISKLVKWGCWKNLLQENGFVYTCSTSIETAAKTVSAPGYNLGVGTCIRVRFPKGNKAANPTLNVNSTGDKLIRVRRGAETLPLNELCGSLTSGAYSWNSGIILELVYDGTYWEIVGNPVVEMEARETKEIVYKLYADGYKEIYGYVRNLTSNSYISVVLPILLKITEYDSSPVPYGATSFGGFIKFINNNEDTQCSIGVGSNSVYIYSNPAGKIYGNFIITGYEFVKYSRGK